jgi:hypothetical protein
MNTGPWATIVRLSLSWYHGPYPATRTRRPWRVGDAALSRRQFGVCPPSAAFSSVIVLPSPLRPRRRSWFEKYGFCFCVLFSNFLYDPFHCTVVLQITNFELVMGEGAKDQWVWFLACDHMIVPYITPQPDSVSIVMLLEEVRIFSCYQFITLVAAIKVYIW